MKSIFALAALLALMVSPAHAGLSMKCLSITPTPAEVRTSIPQDNSRYITLQLKLTQLDGKTPCALAKGDVVMAYGEEQATNNQSQWAMWGSYIIGSADPTATTGKQISARGVENFNPVSSSCWVGRCDVHHLNLVKGGTWISDGAYPAFYVSYVVWSSSSPNTPSAPLMIDPGLGKMQVEVFGP